jgi:chromosome segregation ATPase
MNIVIIAISLTLSGLLFVALTFSSKIIAKKVSGSSNLGEIEAILEESQLLETNIQNAVAYAWELVPLSIYNELIQQREAFEDNLSNERTKLELLEGRLNEIQTKVSVEEQDHANLKVGREEATDLANSIRERKIKLEADHERLTDDLNNSINQLTALSGEIKLTPDQEIGFNKIKSSIKSSQEQMASLSQTYKQASTRFATLHGQYSELEKEFTKLVEKEQIALK